MELPSPIVINPIVPDIFTYLITSPNPIFKAVPIKLNPSHMLPFCPSPPHCPQPGSKNPLTRITIQEGEWEWINKGKRRNGLKILAQTCQSPILSWLCWLKAGPWIDTLYLSRPQLGMWQKLSLVKIFENPNSEVIFWSLFNINWNNQVSSISI